MTLTRACRIPRNDHDRFHKVFRGIPDSRHGTARYIAPFLPRYPPLSPTRLHPDIEIDQSIAVVLGAGIAGLLAAHVASRHFQRVIVLERDNIEDFYNVDAEQARPLQMISGFHLG